jgi:hypothetical protein
MENPFFKGSFGCLFHFSPVTACLFPRLFAMTM